MVFSYSSFDAEVCNEFRPAFVNCNTYLLANQLNIFATVSFAHSYHLPWVFSNAVLCFVEKYLPQTP